MPEKRDAIGLVPNIYMLTPVFVFDKIIATTRVQKTKIMKGIGIAHTFPFPMKRNCSGNPGSNSKERRSNTGQRGIGGY